MVVQNSSINLCSEIAMQLTSLAEHTEDYNGSRYSRSPAHACRRQMYPFGCATVITIRIINNVCSASSTSLKALAEGKTLRTNTHHLIAIQIKSWSTTDAAKRCSISMEMKWARHHIQSIHVIVISSDEAKSSKQLVTWHNYTSSHRNLNQELELP